MTAYFLTVTFLLVLVTSLQTIPMANAQRSLYGEFCNKTVKCDRRSFLACSDTTEGVCGCSRPDEMLYDDVLSKCVSRAGEACRFVREEIDEQNIIYEVTACVPNADCNPDDGFCSCRSSFFENSTSGTCTPAQTHGQPCNSQIKCSRYHGLHCHEGGTCQCQLSTSVYSPTVLPSVTNVGGGQCVGLASQPCINDLCIDGASCDAGQLCRCDSQFYDNHEGECLPKIGIHGNCTENAQCQNYKGQQLVCQNGICDCNSAFSRYGTAQKHSTNWYNNRYNNGRYVQEFYRFDGPAFTQCLGLAGSNCLDHLCVPRAYCSRNNQVDYSAECRCQSGYTQSKSGNCGKSNGQSCDGPESCIDGLFCRQKICRCPFDNQEFSTKLSACVSQIGGPCNATNHCIENSECIFSSPGDQSGHCKCETGFVENLAGKCDVAFGFKCSTASACDQVASLECIDGICGCGKFSRFDNRLRKCVGLAGAKCGVIGGNGECVENAKCGKIHPKLDGRCECLDGFMETDEYTCEQPLAVDRSKRHGDDDGAILKNVNEVMKNGQMADTKIELDDVTLTPFEFVEPTEIEQSRSDEDQ